MLNDIFKPKGLFTQIFMDTHEIVQQTEEEILLLAAGEATVCIEDEGDEENE